MTINARVPRPDEAGTTPVTTSQACPHLVIGLGAIGRSTINRLRHDLTRSADASRRVRFLSIDMEEERSPLGTVPTLLRDHDADFLPLDMASVREYGNQLHGEVREWLSRYDAAMDIGSDQAANPRRLGGLLLAAKTASLRARLEERAIALQDETTTGAAPFIHVVGYLAGGIGGGALTQLLETIRRDPSIIGRGHVVVYGLLPSLGENEGDENHTAAVVNAGAALTELQGSRRQSVRGGAVSEPRELGLRRLCDEILVIAPPKTTGRAALDTQTLPQVLAMTIRQRMLIGVTAAARGANGSFGARSIVALAPKSLTTGADEVEDALTLSIAQSALFQMLHANWRHRRGFVPEPTPMRHADYARRIDAQNRWLLSADHLIQSAAILPSDRDDPNWRLMSEDWTPAIDGMIELARTQSRRDWFDCVTRLCNRRFTQDFRGVGVAAFFQARLRMKREIARVIRRGVEADLFESWARGEIGLADLSAIARELINQQRERLANIDERVANIRVAEEMCRVRVVAANQEWARQRRWDWFGRKSLSLLRAYGVNLQELHINMTRAEGWLFARALLPAVIEELETLRERIERSARALQKGAREADFVLDGLSARLDPEREGTSAFTAHLYDDDALRRLVRDVLSDERGQTELAAVARHLLVDNSSTFDHRGFKPLADWIERTDWMRLLTDLARDQVVGSKGRWAPAAREILDVSIYDALERRSAGDFGRLRDLTADLTRDAAALLPDNAASRFPTRVHVMLPDDPERGEFIKTVRAAFSLSRRGDVRFSVVSGRADAIHLLTVTDPFSISDMELLRQMDEHYRDHIERDREYATMSLHAIGGSDGDGDGSASSDVSRATMTAALLLIGLPLNLVLERTGGATGDGPGIWLVPRDVDGFDEAPIPLADDLLSALDQLSEPIIGMIEDGVFRALDAYEGDPARLIEAIVERVAGVRRRRGDDPSDPTYRAFVNAGKAAVALVREHTKNGGDDGV